MNDEQLTALTDQNYIDWWRLTANSITRGEFREQDGLVIAITGAKEEWWNAIIITSRLNSPSEAVENAVRFFDDRNQPFVLRIREGVDPDAEAASESLGIRYNDTIPGMALAPLSAEAINDAGLDIRTVLDERGVSDFVAVTAEAYGMDPRGVDRFASARLMDDSGWSTYVGYADGEPAVTASLFAAAETAGVYWVGTRNDFRKRGYGEAVTAHVVREGAKLGCTVATLQASEMGRPIYERMGFRVVSPYRTFVRK